jgi:hypothetical protein
MNIMQIGPHAASRRGALQMFSFGNQIKRTRKHQAFYMIGHGQHGILSLRVGGDGYYLKGFSRESKVLL